MGLYDYTIYSVVKKHARANPDKIALIFGDRRITYKQYLEIIDRLSSGLISIGVGKGDRIAVLSQNNAEYLYLYGAAAKIGAIILPINWRLNAEEIAYIISDGSPKVIFAESDFQNVVLDLMTSFGFVEKYISMGISRGTFMAFSDLMKKKGELVDRNVSSKDPFIIVYTAAVDGKPRGAVLSQENVIVANLQYMALFKMSTKDCNLSMLPFFHVAELRNTFSTMHAGGLNIILPKFDVDLALKHIQENKVTMFFCFPPMLENMLHKTQEEKYDLSSLRSVIGLDSPDTIRRFEEISNATYWTGYGQTETTGAVSLAPFRERPGAAGLPGPTSEIEVMDNHGNILEKGKTGEIVVQGPMVFHGYWNLEKDNEYTFRSGWHHTGDLGYFDEGGYLFYCGRKPEKNLIKTGGENVYPAEVENVILQHPLVTEVAVIGVPDPQWSEAIKAICILEPQATVTEGELIEFVETRLARYKRPKYIVFVDAIPKTEQGEIDRIQLKNDFGGQY